MGTFELARVMPGTQEQVFAVVADLPAYGQYILSTRIEHDPGPVQVGWRFTGYTGVGPVRLPDRMEVTRWEPAQGFGVRKLGPVLSGWAEVELVELPRDQGAEEQEGPATLVRWREHITMRPERVGRRLAPLTDPVNRWLFTRALAAMHHRLTA